MTETSAVRQRESGSRKIETWSQFATAAATFLLVITGVWALVFAERQIKEVRDEARMQHLVQLARDFDQPPMAKWRMELAAKRIDGKSGKLRALDINDPPGEMYDVLNFFEQVGVLAKRDYLSKRDILDMFGYWMFNLHADAAPLIKDEQEQDPETFKDFVTVMRDLRELEIGLRGSRADPKPDDIYEFYRAELESPGQVPRPPRRKRK